MTKNTIIYLVRHGETEWNVKRLIQGHSDSPLTEIGINQAKAVAKDLKNIKFDMVFSSDSLRAKKTAELIIAEQKLAVETTKLLRERYFGELEGKPNDALNAFQKVFEKMKDEEISKFRHVDGSETDEEITTRLITFLRELAITHPGKIALAVTHGAVIRAFLVRLGYGTYKTIGWVHNGAYVKIETDGIDFFIKEVKGVGDKWLG